MKLNTPYIHRDTIPSNKYFRKIIIRKSCTFFQKTIPMSTAIIGFALLSACGGGGGGGGSSSVAPPPAPPPPDPNLTGIFTDSPVEGLRYETTTQSGLTNGDGEFIYRAGETVTFSIGGITLGSAPASAELTPFDLFSLTPPATETELRAELRNYTIVSDFDRVANIAFLLLSLDNDGDPENGLDLSGWDEALNTANLNFDANLFAFKYNEFDSFASVFGVSNLVKTSEPLVHLYNSLGITVPINALSLETTDEGNDGSIDRTVGTSYNAAGQISERFVDLDGDGINNLVETHTFSSQGNLLVQNRQFDDDENGTIDRTETETRTYNDNGRLLTNTLLEKDDDNNGTIDQVTNTTRTYNDEGYELSKLYTRDGDGDDVIDYRYEFTYTNDTNGNTLVSLYELDSDGDTDGNAIPNHHNTHTATYDANANKITETTVQDSNEDGITDYRDTKTNTYDTNGNQLTQLIEKDANGDNDADTTINRRQRYISTFDSNNRILTSTYESDENGDEDADESPTSRYVTTYVRDENGNSLKREIAEDFTADGTTDAIETYTSTFDENGNRLTLLNEDDFDNNGTVNYRTTTTDTYDANNNQLSSLVSRDINADGFIDYRRTITNTFDSNSNQINSLRGTDSDGDGIILITHTLREYTYIELSDGLLNLINNYYD